MYALTVLLGRLLEASLVGQTKRMLPRERLLAHAFYLLNWKPGASEGSACRRGKRIMHGREIRLATVNEIHVSGQRLPCPRIQALKK